MAAPRQGGSILFYDGVCGLCSRFVRFVLERDREGRFQFAALQSRFAKETLPRYGKDPTDLGTLYLLTEHGTPSECLAWRARAVLAILGRVGLPWSLARAFRWLPARFLDALYDRVARTRYRVFGKSETCLVPRPEHRERFIEFE